MRKKTGVESVPRDGEPMQGFIPPETVSSRRRLLLGGAAAVAGAGLLASGPAEAQTQQTTGVFNVLTYGATGDGATDDTLAIRSAMTAAWTQGGVVYFPPGRYRCTQLLSLAPSPSAPNTPHIALVGDGRGISALEFTTAASGIEIQFADANRQLTVSGLSLKAGTANAGCALNVTWPNDYGPYARAHIEDLEICPLDATHHYWNYGLRLTGGHSSVIRAVWFRGNVGKASVCGVELVGSNDVSISGCHTTYSDIAFNLEGGAFAGDPRGCEGTVIRDCMMLHHNVGVKSLSQISNGLPWIEVSSCHIFASYRGILVSNRNEATFAHNIIYQADTTNFFVAIECQANCAEASIHDNRLVHQTVTGAPGSWGIVHSGQWSQVNHNVGTMSPCVVLRNLAQFCVAVGNITRVVNGTAVTDETVAGGNLTNKVSLSQPA